MDYFYVGNHGNNVGLQDIYIKFNTSIKKVKLGLDVHMFSAAADVLDLEEKAASGEYKAMDANLGTEIDFYGAFPINEMAMVKFGYSQMLGSNTLQTIKGGDFNETNNWAWLMISIKPNFK